MYQTPVEVYLTCTQIYATAIRMQVASLCTMFNVITLMYTLSPHSPHLLLHSLQRQKWRISNSQTWWQLHSVEVSLDYFSHRRSVQCHQATCRRMQTPQAWQFLFRHTFVTGSHCVWLLTINNRGKSSRFLFLEQEGIETGISEHWGSVSVY